jgi:hypothetical protein
MGVRGLRGQGKDVTPLDARKSDAESADLTMQPFAPNTGQWSAR